MTGSVAPWFRSLWQELVKRHQLSGLPHALMYAGINGIGKHELARYTAQWLLCQQREKGTQPCGQCHSCTLWQAGTHPDFMICQPEDSSRQIRIDSIRKVNDFLAQTPQISVSQVVILTPVEVMNTNAANALLKTLEEPAGESFLLLETERFGSVLPTIRSRCQRLSLQAPTHEEAKAWVLKQGQREEDADSALRYNPQAPYKALEWLELQTGKQQQQWLDSFSQYSQGTMSLEEVVSSWIKLEFDDVIHYFYIALADALKATLSVPVNKLIYGNLISELLNGAMLDRTKLIILQRKVQEVQGSLLSGASHYNKQLLLESLLLDWQSCKMPVHSL